MAKKKKSKRRKSYRKKRGAPKSDRAMPLGTSAGGAVSAFQVLMQKTDSGFYAPIPRVLTFVTEPTVAFDVKADLLGKALKENVMDIERWYPLVGGAIVSAAPKIPLIRMLAKPMDKAIRRASKGKVSL